MQGRSIEPQRAKGRSGGGRSGGIKKVYVGGVDPDVSEAEIRDYFSSFGRVSCSTYHDIALRNLLLLQLLRDYMYAVVYA